MSNLSVDSIVYTLTSDDPSTKRSRTGLAIAGFVFLFMGVFARVEMHAIGMLGAVILSFIGLTLYIVVFAATVQINTIATLNEHHQ